MENRDRQSMDSLKKETHKTAALSPWARYWARQHRMPQDSHMVSFGQRVTYTFAVGKDVASIHYDQARGKIFYKGHNVTEKDVEPGLINLLNHFKDVLAQSEYADKFLKGYTSLLEKRLSYVQKVSK